MTAWPELDFASWGDTKRSLHLYAQMLGKLRLALAPHQPNFLFTSLALTPRGFTTGLMPHGFGALEVSVDIVARTMIVDVAGCATQRISLVEPCTVARVYGELAAALAALGVNVALSPVPQEIPDQTPLDRDERPAAFDRDAAERWLAVMHATNAVFDRWRAHFAGRMGIQLWWGGLDFSLLLFTGKAVEAPSNRGYLLKYDLDTEMMNTGFYPGDAANPPIFYGYIYPQPRACATLPIAPPEASWSDAAGEWILPYDAVRASSDPEAMLGAFLDAIYMSCGWDRDAFTYVRPPLRRGKDQA